MRDRLRAGGEMHVDELREGLHLAGGIREAEPSNLVGLVPGIRLALHVDAVDAAEAAENPD